MKHSTGYHTHNTTNRTFSHYYRLSSQGYNCFHSTLNFRNIVVTCFPFSTSCLSFSSCFSFWFNSSYSTVLSSFSFLVCFETLKKKSDNRFCAKIFQAKHNKMATAGATCCLFHLSEKDWAQLKPVPRQNTRPTWQILNMAETVTFHVWQLAFICESAFKFWKGF